MLKSFINDLDEEIIQKVMERFHKEGLTFRRVVDEAYKSGYSRGYIEACLDHGIKTTTNKEKQNER